MLNERQLVFNSSFITPSSSFLSALLSGRGGVARGGLGRRAIGIGRGGPRRGGGSVRGSRRRALRGGGGRVRRRASRRGRRASRRAARPWVVSLRARCTSPCPRARRTRRP